MKIYTFWRSLATFRVRIAMNLKGIVAEPHTVNLLAGEQAKPDFTAVNPQMAVPALVLDDGTVLFQSMAILEYLDEIAPNPPLMPKTPAARARVRALAQIAVADGHPLVTPRIRNYLEHDLALREDQRNGWLRHWGTAALAAYEGHLARDAATGKFCHGDTVTIADICLASQVVGHGYNGGTLEAFPTVARIHANYRALPAFAAAHPLKQPDAPKG